MHEERSEVDLLDLVDVLRRYKLFLLMSTFAAVVLAALLIPKIFPDVWEATAVLELGRVGGGATNKSEAVDTAVNAVARILSSSFASGVLRDAGFNRGELKAGQVPYRGALKAVKIKDSELIDLSVRAPSAEMAKNQLQSSIAYLQKIHDGVMTASIEKNKKAYQLLNQDIKNVSSELDVIKKKLLTTHDWNTFDATLAATIMKDKFNQLQALNQAKLTMEEQQSSERTYSTRILGDMDVSEGPVAPNKKLLIGVAGLLGLFGSLILSFAHRKITSNPVR